MPLGDFVVCLHRTGQPNVLSAIHNVATPCIGSPRMCKEEKPGRENMLVMLGLGGEGDVLSLHIRAYWCPYLV